MKKLTESIMSNLKEEETKKSATQLYYEDLDREKSELINNLDMKPVYDWIKEVLGLSYLDFKEERLPERGRIEYESTPIKSEDLGVAGFIFKEATVSSFSCGASDSNYDSYRNNTIPDKIHLVYYTDVHLSYRHWDGGTNGSVIGTASYDEGKWSFKLEKDRNRGE